MYSVLKGKESKFLRVTTKNSILTGISILNDTAEQTCESNMKQKIRTCISDLLFLFYALLPINKYLLFQHIFSYKIKNGRIDNYLKKKNVYVVCTSEFR